MTYKLGTNVCVGQKIKTAQGWRKIKEVTNSGAVVKEGIINFGEVIYGWTIK